MNNGHWDRMERVWEDFDARICGYIPWDELDEGLEASGGVEIQAEGSTLGCLMGEASIQEGPDNLHQVRKEDG